MDIADIDTEYYKDVWTTQNDPRILKDELQNLINDCLRVKKDAVATVLCSGGVISPPLLMAMITNFMGKVNRVTSQHRHGIKVSDRTLTRLSNKQIDLENLMEELGL